MDKRKKLYIDFDNTIVDTNLAICSLYNEDFQYYKKFKEVKSHEINTWGFLECNCATPEYINYYFNQPRFFERLQFMPNAKEVIEKLKEEYDVEILTLGYSPNCIGKQLWVSKHLPNTKMTYINLKEYKDKSHIDGTDAILLDDKSSNLYTFGGEKVLFGVLYSWNKDWNGIRLYNWIDVENYFLGRS